MIGSYIFGIFLGMVLGIAIEYLFKVSDSLIALYNEIRRKI
jgi:hypothetical protein